MKYERPLRKCKKCGWQWFGRKEKSYLCPKCHTPKWDDD